MNKQILERAERVTRETIAPRASQYDVAGANPIESWRALWREGLLAGISHTEVYPLTLFAVGGTAPVDTATVVTAMVGWHTLIGIGECFITALVVATVVAVRPDLCYGARRLLADRPLELRTEVAR